MDNEGISEELKNCFLVYLMSHNRPIIELLAPTLKDITEIYEREFVGMTSLIVHIDDLYHARNNLITQITNMLNERDRKFLLTFKGGEPDWESIYLSGCTTLACNSMEASKYSQHDEGKEEKSIRKT